MIWKGGKHIKITDYPKLTGGVNTNEGKQKDIKNLEQKWDSIRGKKKRTLSHLCKYPKSAMEIVLKVI